MNNHADRPLITMPKPATHITVVLMTAGGFARRCSASQPMAPQATNSSMALPSAARMELPRRP